jgi:DNA-binding MarR family transcriptional regulator/GNAT superfamily N-acetyltransferase
MDAVARIRRFNRTVTQAVGALDTEFLGRKRSLGASRLLFEIAGGNGELRTLRARLELDSGYTSRLLRGLEREGLVRTTRDPNDRRTRILAVTAAGRREVAKLDRSSDAAARTILAPLSTTEHAALLDAMATVEKALLHDAIRVEVESPASPDAERCLARYFAELAHRFDAGFDPARGISASIAELTPPAGYFVIARLRGDAVGCGALKVHPTFGEVKRMWVDPATRGLGIGRHLLDSLERLARAAKLPKVRLETNRSLAEAQALYRRSGYREVPAFNTEPYAHHWFEKRISSLAAR